MNRRDFVKSLFASAAVIALPVPNLGEGDFTVEMWARKVGETTWIDEFRVSRGVARYTESYYLDDGLVETRPARAAEAIQMGDMVAIYSDRGVS